MDRPCRVFLAACLASTVLSVPAPARAQTKFISGNDTIYYDIINPKGVCSIPDYTDNGFSQKTVASNAYSRTVKVSVSLTPLNDVSHYPLSDDDFGAKVRQYLAPSKDIQSDDPSVAALAGSLTKNAVTVMQAYTDIMNWVADNLTYVIDTRQDAVSVLSDRTGSCVGYSNLSIALLRAAGIPARSVRGYVPPGYDWGEKKNYWGVTLNSGGFHEWLEVYFPGQGWVLSDAESSKNFVDAFHIVLDVEGEDLHSTCMTDANEINVDQGTSFTIAKENNTMEPVDQIDDTRKLVLSRQQGRPVHGRIVFTVTDGHGVPLKDAQAVVWHGLKGHVYPADDRGRFFFVGHDQGTYTISFMAPHYAELRTGAVVADGTTSTKTIVLGPGLTISGTVIDGATGRPVTSGRVILWEGTRGKIYPLSPGGRFEFNGVKPAHYGITVEAAGYEKFSAGLSAGKDVTRPKDVNLLIKLKSGEAP